MWVKDRLEPWGVVTFIYHTAPYDTLRETSSSSGLFMQTSCHIDVHQMVLPVGNNTRPPYVLCSSESLCYTSPEELINCLLISVVATIDLVGSLRQQH